MNQTCVNHSSKLLVDRQKLTTRRHKIDPSKPRIIINKYDIIGATPFETKGSTAPYIRVNEIKRTLRHRITRRIGELQLFAKLATCSMTSNVTKNKI